MKKGLLTLTTILISVGAFAQGKLLFQVDSTQLIYMTTHSGRMNPYDVGKTVAGFPLAGSSLYTGAGSTVASLAGAPSFTAALFAGATAGSLSEVVTTTLADVNLAGQLNPVNVTLAGLSAGTPAFFQIQVFDSRYANAAAAWASFDYAGETGVFSAVPSAGAYSPLYQTSSPVNSTLPAGTFVPNDYAAYPGYKGLIEVGVFFSPEPGTFALVGCGAAVLMLFRRPRAI